MRFWTHILENLMAKYRFQDLEIWKTSLEITDRLFDLADVVEKKKHFRFAEQLRGAVLSISNNIAEGSGSTFIREFARFLNIARRSAFEVTNMLIILHRRDLITTNQLNRELEAIDQLCRMIHGFTRSLFKKHRA